MWKQSSLQDFHVMLVLSKTLLFCCCSTADLSLSLESHSRRYKGRNRNYNTISVFLKKKKSKWEREVEWEFSHSRHEINNKVKNQSWTKKKKEKQYEQQQLGEKMKKSQESLSLAMKGIEEEASETTEPAITWTTNLATRLKLVVKQEKIRRREEEGVFQEKTREDIPGRERYGNFNRKRVLWQSFRSLSSDTGRQLNENEKLSITTTSKTQSVGHKIIGKS